MSLRSIRIVIVAATIFLLIASIAVAGPSNGKGKGNKTGIAKVKTSQPAAKGSTNKPETKGEKSKPEVENKNLGPGAKSEKKESGAKSNSALSGTISGETLLVTKTASNETTTTLEHVHLRLLIEKNSKLKTVKAAQSNKSGNFLFKNIKPGDYILKVWAKNAYCEETITVTSFKLDAGETENRPPLIFHPIANK